MQTPSPTPTSEPSLGVYLHWPFCEAICPYCDFNVTRARELSEEVWFKAFCGELDHMRALTEDRRLETIFFGGGTPSLMSPELVRRLIGHVRSLWSPADDVEVSLEANPTDAEADRSTAFAEAGITRLSLGVQSLRDDALKFLGRWHSADDARHAIEVAKRSFRTVSADLIFGRPGQTVDAWRDELGEALGFGLPHLSLYQLTIEPGTAFARAADRGKLVMESDDTLASLYELSQDLCTEAGLSAYEVSNYARPGYECRHNLRYWRQRDYVGVGPGAHGRLMLAGRRHATETVRAPRKWLEQALEDGHAVDTFDALPPQSAAAEFVLMGLRLEQGISLTGYGALAGAPLPENKLTRLCDNGFLSREGDRLTATARGRLVLDRLVRELLI